MKRISGVALEGRRALTSRLAFRIGVGSLVGAAVILATAGAWNVRRHREHMEGLLAASAIRATETIRLSTRDAMLRNDPGGVERILNCIGDDRGVERIRIFDKEGRIRVSTAADEVGEMVDKGSELCVICHREGETFVLPAATDRIRKYRMHSGERLLGVTSPIRNEPDCTTACHAHSPDQKLLGVIDVHLSLGPVDAYLVESERELAIGMTGTVIVLLLVVGLLVWRLVLLPVRRLTRATLRLGEGDFSTRVAVGSDDEMGDLGHAWNAMALALGSTQEELEHLNRTLENRVEHKTLALEAAHGRMLVVEKMASLGKLAAIVAHEVNNPLAGIGTYAKLLRKKIARRAVNERRADDQEAERILAMMEEEASRCGRIVKNLLMFSRTPGPRVSVTELRPLLERSLMLVRHQADLQDVEIRLDSPPGLPSVECDASQVQQVALVLCMNAIEAMPNGGVLKLAARVAPDPAEVQIEVADTGCGIPPELLGHVFEPFYTTKDEEQGKGVGLGLAVAYGIVQRHRGRIEVESEIGRGTVFRVLLPLRQPESDATTEEPARPEPMTPPGKI